MVARRTLRALVSLLALAPLVAAVACVLAEPPADLPTTPREAPQILHDQVSPATTQVIESWPWPEFDVPIRVNDPNASIAWRAFIDYDRITNPSIHDEGVLDPSTRTLRAQLVQSVNSAACHTIQIVVAFDFSGDHTPGPVGGDSVSWIYSPTGSLDGCPVFDGGAPDAAPDSSSLGDAGPSSDGGLE